MLGIFSSKKEKELERSVEFLSDRIDRLYRDLYGSSAKKEEGSIWNGYYKLAIRGYPKDSGEPYEVMKHKCKMAYFIKEFTTRKAALDWADSEVQKYQKTHTINGVVCIGRIEDPKSDRRISGTAYVRKSGKWAYRK